MAKIDFQMVITDEAVTYARFAQNNAGWKLVPKRWAVTSSSGELSVTRNTASMYNPWITQPFSGVYPSEENKLLHSIVIPPDAYATDMNIGEIYFIYEDYYGNEFLYAIAQPQTSLMFTVGVSQSYAFAFALNNTNVADTITVNYTYPQDIEDHNQRPDSHIRLLARDGSRTATGVLSYDQKLSFTHPRQIVDKEYTDNVTQVIQDAIDKSYCPPGTLMMWPKTTPPSGWLVRDGSAISRTTYADLFAVIGTLYGAGNGSTTFNLPDDRGIFERGWDGGKGIDTSREFGSYQEDAVNLSNLQIYMRTWHNSKHGVGGGSINYATAAGGGSGESAGSFLWSATGIITGAKAANENRVKNRAYLPIIKY